jgi:hypothetical protein
MRNDINAFGQVFETTIFPRIRIIILGLNVRQRIWWTIWEYGTLVSQLGHNFPRALCNERQINEVPPTSRTSRRACASPVLQVHACVVLVATTLASPVASSTPPFSCDEYNFGFLSASLLPAIRLWESPSDSATYILLLLKQGLLTCFEVFKWSSTAILPC